MGHIECVEGTTDRTRRVVCWTSLSCPTFLSRTVRLVERRYCTVVFSHGVILMNAIYSWLGTSPTLHQLTNALRTVPSPAPSGFIFPKTEGSQPPPKTSIAIISGKGEATGFKFGGYIHKVHPNKNSLKTLEKRECGCMQGLPKFFEYPLLSPERVKLQT